MSRSGYIDDDIDNWALIKWRGQVASAIRGKRGQKMLRDMLAALDQMPKKELIANELVCDDGVCAFGALGISHGLDMSGIDPDNADWVASIFDIAPQLAMEVVYMNDEAGWYNETPRARYERMRRWVIANINGDIHANPEVPA